MNESFQISEPETEPKKQTAFDRIDQYLKENTILLFMKGSPELPQCGFSSQVVEILSQFNINFAYINVLLEPEIRSAIKEKGNWPTFPQLWIKGELIGGCDILMEMYQTDELKQLLEPFIKH